MHSTNNLRNRLYYREYVYIQIHIHAYIHKYKCIYPYTYIDNIYTMVFYFENIFNILLNYYSKLTIICQMCYKVISRMRINGKLPKLNRLPLIHAVDKINKRR